MSENKQSKSIIYKKLYAFVINIFKTYKHLSLEKKEIIVSKQLLRVKVGKLVDANINVAISA